MKRVSLALATLFAIVSPGTPAGDAWPTVSLPKACDVELAGPIGDDLKRGVDRLALAPYTTPWLLADISFAEKRIFTNYSGDVSGRFLELASLTSPPDKFVPATLQPVLEQALRFQKPDGHFGADFDLARRFESNTTQKVAPLPMFWGNGRILVGLIAVAQERNRPDYLDAARKLGDYYVSCAEQMLSPAREKEFRATGTYGDSYVCDYFPAIEGMALLYRATKDERYLKVAQRMAEFFKKFDALPIDHSHGNLCAWRGHLLLYGLTGERPYLDAARAKWDAAVNGGFVWPIGGVGEHWHVSYPVTEGCSESDWLRFNLDLWRFTGERRYLDMAERVLWNQYRMNQSPNGGFGSRHLEADAAGPFAVKARIEEWNFCCGFHGPLGLHFLKQYLAAGSERAIFINFPLGFTGKLKAAGRTAVVTVKTDVEAKSGFWRMEIQVAPGDAADPLHTVVHVRVPDWASVADVQTPGKQLKTEPQSGVLSIEHDFKAGEKTVVLLRPAVHLEGRRFQRVVPEQGTTARLKDVAILSGPHVLFAAPASGSGRPALLATSDAQGSLSFPIMGDGGLATIALSSVDSADADIAAALESAPVMRLRPWGTFSVKQRAPFMCNLVVVPAASLDAKRLESLANRARATATGATGPSFGENLEKKRELWPDVAGWTFKPEGLLVAGGDTGLMNGEGFKDYRFEFDLTLPPEGQGIAGWIVRARDAENCVMYQLQSADSPYSAPEYKTKPNTLRPHVRRNGQWEMSEPLLLPKEIRRGEAHHIVVNCRGDTVEVQVDGTKAHTMRVPDHREGTVGFRASGPAEQGLYRKITLRPPE
ncbi:MAG: glycoside hydrolase family 127 protein [Planctomycetota bacterium]|nr:glycoside hydrolase family 127 protein [Planctomycetota bacterium]